MGHPYLKVPIKGKPGFAAPCVTFRLVVVSLRALDSHALFPSRVACCVGLVLSVGRYGQCSYVVSAFAEPSGWCAEGLKHTET